MELLLAFLLRYSHSSHFHRHSQHHHYHPNHWLSISPLKLPWFSTKLKHTHTQIASQVTLPETSHPLSDISLTQIESMGKATLRSMKHFCLRAVQLLWILLVATHTLQNYSAFTIKLYKLTKKKILYYYDSYHSWKRNLQWSLLEDWITRNLMRDYLCEC